MKHIVDTAWKGNMKFEADLDGHKIMVDGSVDVGGENAGPGPKRLLMVALAGCTGMDVVSILKKMHVELDFFNLKIEGDLSDEHPKFYKSMHIIYQFKGKDLDPEKLRKAVDLSQEKYCGVAATLRKALDLTYEIQIL